MITRNTKTKSRIIALFKNSHKPLLMNDVYVNIKKTLPKTAYSTVYRIIMSFHSQGMLKQIDWRERGCRFEWAGFEHHHHLVCQECGKITKVDDQLLKFRTEDISQKTGFYIKDHSIEIFGECSPCHRRNA